MKPENIKEGMLVKFVVDEQYFAPEGYDPVNWDGHNFEEVKFDENDIGVIIHYPCPELAGILPIELQFLVEWAIVLVENKMFSVTIKTIKPLT